MDLVSGTAIVFFLLAILAIIIFAKTAIVVPQQSAYVVERLGRFAGTLDAGFHILVPFVDVIRYRHSLKEQSRSTSRRRSASRATTCRSASTACST